MLSKKDYEKYVARTLEYFEKAGIALTEKEKNSVEVVDWGLNEVEVNGLEIITYVNTERVCAKEMVLFPGAALSIITWTVTDRRERKKLSGAVTAQSISMWTESLRRTSRLSCPPPKFRCSTKLYLSLASSTP